MRGGCDCVSQGRYRFTLAEACGQARWKGVNPQRLAQARGTGIGQAQATSLQTPPASLMRLSAFLENSLALHTKGTLGSSPAPRTLKKPFIIIKSATYGLDDINYNSLGGGGGLAGVLRHQSPDLVEVDRRLVLLVALEMEVALALLTEVSGMAITRQKGVLILTTSPS